MSAKKPSEILNDRWKSRSPGVEAVIHADIRDAVGPILNQHHSDLLELRGKVERQGTFLDGLANWLVKNDQLMSDAGFDAARKYLEATHLSPDPSAAMGEWPKWTATSTVVWRFPDATSEGRWWCNDGSQGPSGASWQTNQERRFPDERDITHDEAIALIPAIADKYPLARPATPAEHKPTGPSVDNGPRGEKRVEDEAREWAQDCLVWKADERCPWIRENTEGIRVGQVLLRESSIDSGREVLAMILSAFARSSTEKLEAELDKMEADAMALQARLDAAERVIEAADKVRANGHTGHLPGCSACKDASDYDAAKHTLATLKGKA